MIYLALALALAAAPMAAGEVPVGSALGTRYFSIDTGDVCPAVVLDPCPPGVVRFGDGGCPACEPESMPRLVERLIARLEKAEARIEELERPSPPGDLLRMREDWDRAIPAEGTWVSILDVECSTTSR